MVEMESQEMGLSESGLGDNISDLRPSDFGEGGVYNQVSNPSYIAKLLQARDVYGNVYFGDVEYLEPARFPWEYQEYLKCVYVPNDAAIFERFKSGVVRRGYGYIVGQEGSGREAAAVALLTEKGYPAHYFLLEEGEQDQLVRTPQRKKQGYVVDLSNFSGSMKSVRRSLLSFWSEARKNNSVVLVVMRPGQRGNDPFESTPLESSPVSGAKIFASHIEHLTGKSSKMWESEKKISHILSGATPEEAVRLARIAADVHMSTQVEGKEWIAKVLKAHGGWGEQLEDWFGRNSGKEGAWARVVLASCSLLEGVSVEKVLELADRLAKNLGIPPGDAGGFLGASMGSTLKMVGANKGSGGVVRFDRHHYGAAVLDYIWNQHPRMKVHLFDWSSDVLSELDDHSIEILADSWALLVVRQNESGWVNKVFNRWAKEPKTLAAAVAFGSRVSMVSGFGKRMRRRLYDVSTDPVSPTQARSVALICQRFGKGNPSSALVRLKRLASTDNSTVKNDIVEALDSLADENETWVMAIEEVVQWVCSSDKERSRLGMRYLCGKLTEKNHGNLCIVERLNIVNGEPDEGVVQGLVLIWSALFDTGDSSLVSGIAEEWVPLALEESDRGRVISEAFFSAVLGNLGSSKSSVAARSLTASHAVGLWRERNGNESGMRQESVWSLYSDIIRIGADYKD
ncbi:hypothetical protein ACFV4I_17440 [Nocardiopsis alba]|uniref:hypothetical protein n=1 Tax=Nocardiopsis alba TaxID=53437 RepID=UPI003659F89D